MSPSWNSSFGSDKWKNSLFGQHEEKHLNNFPYLSREIYQTFYQIFDANLFKSCLKLHLNIYPSTTIGILFRH